MLSVLCIVCSYFLKIDTSAKDEGEGRCAVKPV